MPTVSDAYLTGNVPNRVAIVRGHYDADGFRAHTAGSAYMVQWNDMYGINSIVFDNYAGRRFGLDIDIALGTMTLTDPPPYLPLTAYAGVAFEIGVDKAYLHLQAESGEVVATQFPDGLLTAGGFSTWAVRSGPAST